MSTNSSSCDLHAFPAYGGAEHWTAAASALIMAENGQRPTLSVASIRLTLPYVPLLVSCSPAFGSTLPVVLSAVFCLTFAAVHGVRSLRAHSTVSNYSYATGPAHATLRASCSPPRFNNDTVLFSAAPWHLHFRMGICTSISCWCSLLFGVSATRKVWCPF